MPRILPTILKSQQRKVDINTIYNYLDALNNAFCDTAYSTL